MTSLIGRMFWNRHTPPHQDSRGDLAYAHAMTVSGDLLTRMQECSRSTDAARAIMADVWAQNHNAPFLTTVFEAVQEAKSPIVQNPADK